MPTPRGRPQTTRTWSSPGLTFRSRELEGRGTQGTPLSSLLEGPRAASPCPRCSLAGTGRETLPRLRPGTTWQARRKAMTAHSMSTGDHTAPRNGLNCPGSRGCQSLGKYRLRNGYDQPGPVLRKTEPAGEVCCVLCSCSALPPSHPMKDPGPANWARRRLWLGDCGRKPGCGSGHFCRVVNGDQKLQAGQSPRPSLP